jgi:two-component system, cell cycle response regulator
VETENPVSAGKQADLMSNSDRTIRQRVPAPLLDNAPKKPCLTVLYGGPVGLVYTLPAGSETLIGRGEEADIPLLEERVSRKHALITVSKEGGVFIEDQESSNGTFVNRARIKRQELKEGDRIQIGYSCIIKFAYQDDLEYQLQQEIASGIKDPLTGLYTKMYFQDRVNTEFADAQRHDENLGVLLFAVDHFSKISIHYGQAAADLITKEVARHVTEMLRAGDVFARYDEERLAILARRLDDKGSVILARRIRKIVQDRPVEFDGAPIQLTVSIGIATLADKPKKAAELIEIAEKSLNKTKDKAGQNGIGGAAVTTYLRTEEENEAPTIFYAPNERT